MDAAVKLPALAAENDLGKTMLAGVAVTFAVLAGMDHASADQFFLDQQEDAALRTSIQLWIGLSSNFVAVYFKSRSGDPCHNGSCVVPLNSEGFTD